MNKLIIFCALLTKYLAQSAADVKPNELYIFNVNKESSFFIRLREEKAPHIVLKPFNSCMVALTEEIFKLPASTCIKVSHDLKKSGRLRLRIWPEDYQPDPYEPISERFAFCGKLIPQGGNILMLGYPSEWKRSAMVELRSKGYIIERNKITRESETPSKENLCVLRAHSFDINRFKTDLGSAVRKLYQQAAPAYFETIGDFSKPILTSEIMSVVFDLNM